MTTQVKAKPVSQIRQEAKILKMKKKAKQIAKLAKDKEAKNTLQKAMETNREEYLKGLGQIKIAQPKVELPLDEYFVQEVGNLDQTLTDILASIQSMGQLRTTLKWDALKANFDKEQADAVEAQLVDLETANKVFEENAIISINGSVEKLEALKKAPTREALDAFVLEASTQAFVIFSEWNETIIDKFHTVSDLLDSLKAGEEK